MGRRLFLIGLMVALGLPFTCESRRAGKMPRVAICYWGLTRSTKKVFQSHYENIFKILQEHGIPYDVFLHTWALRGPQYAWWTPLTDPIDYEEYQLLKPDYFRRDDQDLFTDALDFSQYYYEWEKDTELPPRLIFNHLCALESQKRVTDMVYESGNEYDYIIYVRPDVRILTAFDVRWLNLRENAIVIPDNEHYLGYNDRFAILPYANVAVYGKRIDQIIEFRKNVGGIISEKYVKHVCEANKLNVKFVPFHFQIVRPDRFT